MSDDYNTTFFVLVFGASRLYSAQAVARGTSAFTVADGFAEAAMLLIIDEANEWIAIVAASEENLRLMSKKLDSVVQGDSSVVVPVVVRHPIGGQDAAYGFRPAAKKIINRLDSKFDDGTGWLDAAWEFITALGSAVTVVMKTADGSIVPIRPMWLN